MFNQAQINNLTTDELIAYQHDDPRIVQRLAEQAEKLEGVEDLLDEKCEKIDHLSAKRDEAEAEVADSIQFLRDARDYCEDIKDDIELLAQQFQAAGPLPEITVDIEALHKSVKALNEHLNYSLT